MYCILREQIHEWTNNQCEITEDQQGKYDTDWKKGIHLMLNEGGDLNETLGTRCFQWAM